MEDWEGQKAARFKAWERRQIAAMLIITVVSGAMLIGMSVLLITVLTFQGFITLLAFGAVIIAVIGLMLLADRWIHEEEPKE